MEREPDGGEYLQLFAAPFEDRFFFELVERRGNYVDYGMANAPMRLAALAQWRESRSEAIGTVVE